ncbi:Gfo/Idh/MocA family oxidoreductase [Noviherbaspirillum sp.]|jgi:UDP-N-acetyl-2-amino-2-deoxyglucuronate dehydrogenase|uniref:Gfo/Idh/MocA family protein n=1 Tax=Noviherbaspirillum sp. TaxID=1926288 RepID=UPI0025D527A7|nr:Gfo/Idh/MocA family oxidoreductase [Noviherbaspirillum sp.]
MNQFPPAYSNRYEDRKIRFGLVGCGRISKNHIAAIRQHEDSCELVGVCDVDPRALEAAVDATDVKAYRSLDVMLAECKADVFVLATPSGLHSSQAIQVAQAGRHVITEKPMATRWEDGKRMVAACDEARVRLFVVKQNRHNTTLQLLKKAIEGKRFGKINMVNLNVFWTRPQEYYDSAKWRGTWEYDGGAFMNQASHYVDLVEWLVGPVESLHAYTATLQRNIEVEDTGVLSLRWRNGALGSVNVTMLTYPKNLEGSITVLGERGTVRIGGVALNEVQHWEFADHGDDDDKVMAASYETGSVYGFGHAKYYDNVIKVLRGDAEPETDGREGLKTLEVLIATYLSARDGKRIALPMEY